MVKISEHRLLTAEELPHSDDTPVDNELQNLIPNLLLSLLLDMWCERDDWFFAVDMAAYYAQEEPAIVPDGFLAMGVPRNTGSRGRLSYLIWQENYVVPMLVLEVVSHKYNGEYVEKLAVYQQLGVLYYVVYNPLAGSRGRHRNRLEIEVYKLVNNQYELISGNPVWMREIGLGIGCEFYNYANWERVWLFWYDQEGNRCLTEREKKEQERQAKEQERQAKEQERFGREQERQAKEQERQAKEQERQAKEQERFGREQERQAKEQERQAKEKLASYLRGMGINPDDIT